MLGKDYWVLQSDKPALYTNVPGSSGHRGDLVTYVYYVGGLPDVGAATSFPNWDSALHTRLVRVRPLDRAPDTVCALCAPPIPESEKGTSLRSRRVRLYRHLRRSCDILRHGTSGTHNGEG